MIKKIFIAIIVIIVLVVLASLIGRYSFDRMVSKEITELFKAAGNIKPEKVTEEDIARLPEPVQKFMRYVKAVGADKIHSVRLKQTGKIRLKPDAKWMPFTAEQYYNVDDPSFIWKADVKMAPLLGIAGRDKLTGGHGFMLIKILSLINVVNASGAEMDQGALSRFLNEVMWFPTAYTNDYIKWEPIDSTSARAVMTMGGATASAVLKFDNDGKLVDFVAERFMSSGDKFVKELWSTPVTDYIEFNGILLPKGGKAIWKLKSGDFSYIQLEITEIEYNVPEEY